MRKILRKSTYLGVLLLGLASIVSCEEDFTNINSGVVTNTKFTTNDTILDVVVTNAPIERLRADGLALNQTPFFGFQGQYLLGTYISDSYENIEASIVSQVNINPDLSLTSYANPDNLSVQTSIDTAFIKLPYQVTLESRTTRPVFKLDSVIGDTSLPFTLNIYELETYLNNLNPLDPSKVNYFATDEVYQTKNTSLTAVDNMDFMPNPNDTLVIIKRRNSLGDLHDTDTIKYTTSSDLPFPMAIIPLKETFVKEVFLDNYNTPNFASQDAFNNYFRGIILEAKEKTHASGKRGGSLISFNLRNSSSESLRPLIEVYYTNTYFKANSSQIDTVIKQKHTFQLGGIINNSYKMNHKTYPANNQVVLQGAAGSEAKVEILSTAQIAALRSKNWLINDAELTFYINQASDTSNVANQLYLYKRGEDANGKIVASHVKDILSEGIVSFDGRLRRENNKKDRYIFGISDYLSDILSGATSYNPPLRLKVYNSSDTQITDTIFTNYNWNPKAVSILNGDETLNGERRAKLKISYTVKN
ncbi:DUF4270 family protein [Polaribacter tangerinus]|uniref:DUF4270 family protein n=1 Tax=Polaribacter tangerinus TaxID=1920034 RepID=UPI001303B729|nr:DUF4270 family protein [Polaribacter tangerinus]